MINWDLRTYTKEQFIEAWYSSSSLSQCAVKLDLSKNGGTYKSIKLAVEDLNLTSEHMSRKKEIKNGKVVYNTPLEEILVKNSTWSSTSDLRKKLINQGILKPICVGCNKSEAYNFNTDQMEPINFHLDHINGNNFDNRIENLRLLCPTCHSFTPTYAGKNRNKLNPNFCKCGVQIDRKSEICASCRKLLPTKLSQYSDKELLDGVISLGYYPYAKLLGVADNTIRKELRRRNLPLPKKPKGPAKKNS